MWTLLAIAAVGFAAFGLFVWYHDVRARKAFEATATATEREQFKGFRMVAPWRKFSGHRRCEGGD
jgi:hypothetical protein